MTSLAFLRTLSALSQKWMHAKISIKPETTEGL
jgi:hypothetical protein